MSRKEQAEKAVTNALDQLLEMTSNSAGATPKVESFRSVARGTSANAIVAYLDASNREKEAKAEKEALRDELIPLAVQEYADKVMSVPLSQSNLPPSISLVAEGGGAEMLMSIQDSFKGLSAVAEAGLRNLGYGDSIVSMVEIDLKNANQELVDKLANLLISNFTAAELSGIIKQKKVLQKGTFVRALQEARKSKKGKVSIMTAYEELQPTSSIRVK